MSTDVRVYNKTPSVPRPYGAEFCYVRDREVKTIQLSETQTGKRSVELLPRTARHYHDLAVKTHSSE